MKKRILSILICLTVVFSTLLIPTSVSAASKISLNKTNVTISKGATYTLKLNGAKASKVKWKTKNSKIVKVNKGKISAIKKGTTYITAKYNGKSYKCKVVVMTRSALDRKIISAYDWHCNDIWNNGFCNIYHYIEEGKDALGEEMDVDSTISLINKNWEQRSKWNSFVNSVVGSKYSKFKKTWRKADKEAVKLKEILDNNGAPKPKSDYYFPYERYSDLIWELFAECPTN